MRNGTLLFLLTIFSFQTHAADLCEDAFISICKDSYLHNSRAENDKGIKSLVEEARTETLKQLGYSDPDAAFIDVLKNKGFELKKDLSADKVKQVRKLDLYRNYSGLKEYFTPFESCSKAPSELSGAKYSSDPKRVQEIISKYEPVRDQVKNLLGKLTEDGVPAMFKAIKSECMSLFPEAWGSGSSASLSPYSGSYSPADYSSTGYPGPSPSPTPNPKLEAQRDFCTKTSILAVRQDAVAAFRSPMGSELRNAFMKKYSAKYLELTQVRAKPTEVVVETDPLKIKVAELESVLNYQTCSKIEDLARQTFPVIKDAFMKNVEYTQFAHDYLLDHLYTSERKTVVANLVNFTKKSLVAFLDKNFKGEADYEAIAPKIRSEYAKIKLLWPDKLSAEHYKKVADFPLPILDMETISPLDEFWPAMVYSKLEAFTAFNAYYHPLMQMGELGQPEAFTVLPAFLFYLKDEPRALIEVIGHELGHKIGWLVSKINGHDLRKQWAPVVDCLASEGSIHLKKSVQEDESLADWLASYVVKDYIASLAVEEREKVLIKSMSPYCLFTDIDVNPNDFLAGHPEASERLDGILMANRELRALMQCNDAARPYRYRSCEVPAKQPALASLSLDEGKSK